MRADRRERSRERHLGVAKLASWAHHDRVLPVLNKPGIGVRSPLDSVKIAVELSRLSFRFQTAHDLEVWNPQSGVSFPRICSLSAPSKQAFPQGDASKRKLRLPRDATASPCR